jgi:hypothetical protein
MAPEKIGRFIENLDADNINTISNLSEGAIEAIGKWSANELQEFGSEIIQRSEKDAEAIALTNQLLQLDLLERNPQDLAEAEALITKIGELSVNGTGNRFVLGNWIDYAKGFIDDARTNGGLFYSTNPEVYNLIFSQYNKLDEPLKEKILWEINEAAIEEGIQKGLGFDFSFTSASQTVYQLESDCVKSLLEGDISSVMNVLNKDYLPARYKELQILINEGYLPEFDDASQIIHWISNY